MIHLHLFFIYLKILLGIKQKISIYKIIGMNDDNRVKFVQNTVNFVSKNDFDGVDWTLDSTWET